MNDPRILELIAVEHASGARDEETPTDGDGGASDGTDQADHAGEPVPEDEHCGLCELRDDREAWDAVSEELGVTVSVHASDELSPEQGPVVREVGTPCVVARFDDNEHHAVVLAERLEVFDGDVTRLVREVRLVAEQRGWALPIGAEPESQPETI